MTPSSRRRTAATCRARRRGRDRVNALWDAAPRIGDRVAVVGAGMVGCAVAALLGRFPLDRLRAGRRRPVACRGGRPSRSRLVDPAQRAERAATWSCTPRPRPRGWQRSLELLGDEGEVIELSWYGDGRRDACRSGAAFHPRRLTSGPARSARSPRRGEPGAATAIGCALALDLLRDDRFDALITGSSPFAELPDTMRRLASGELPALCHVDRLLAGTEGGQMFAVTVRDHVMVAHSLPRPVFGPAQGLHGATYVVEATFRRASSTTTASSSTSAPRRLALGEILDRLRYRNLDDLPRLRGLVTTTEVLTRWVADRLAEHDVATGLDGLEVVLRESPDAWVTYSEGPTDEAAPGRPGRRRPADRAATSTTSRWHGARCAVWATTSRSSAAVARRRGRPTSCLGRADARRRAARLPVARARWRRIRRGRPRAHAARLGPGLSSDECRRA